MSDTPRTSNESHMAEYMVRQGKWTNGEAESRAWEFAAELAVVTTERDELRKQLEEAKLAIEYYLRRHLEEIDDELQHLEDN